MKNLEYYWHCIGIGRENAVTYPQLCALWNCNARKVRQILHELSYMDNDDSYILIRSSHGKGFYKTDNIEEIERYKREVTNRAIHTFKSLRKIRRVIKENEQKI